MDQETRETLDRLGTDLREDMQTVRTELRSEIQTSAADTRAYVDERIQVSGATLLQQIQEQIRASEERMRRHFEVVGESLRGDIRGVAELVALSNEASKRRDDELAERTDGLEGRVARLEVRVLRLEDNRKPRPPRRRR